jgi:hypothetical protein
VGPVPGGGGTISGITAAIGSTNAAAMTLTVFDNGLTTGVSCTIAIGATTCSATGSASIGAGHWVQVQETGAAGTPPDMQASVRYQGLIHANNQMNPGGCTAGVLRTPPDSCPHERPIGSLYCGD